MAESKAAIFVEFDHAHATERALFRPNEDDVSGLTLCEVENLSSDFGILAEVALHPLRAVRQMNSEAPRPAQRGKVQLPQSRLRKPVLCRIYSVFRLFE